MEKLVILDFSTGEVDIYPIEYECEPDIVNISDEYSEAEVLPNELKRI